MVGVQFVGCNSILDKFHTNLCQSSYNDCISSLSACVAIDVVCSLALALALLCCVVMFCG